MSNSLLGDLDSGSTIGTRVRMIRDSQSLTQQDVADELGLSRSAVTNIEADRQKLTFAHAIKLAGLFRVPLDELAGLTPESQSTINAYEQGYERGFREGRNRAENALRRALAEVEGA